MDIKNLNEPLKIEDIEFRVQSLVKKGDKVYGIILAYKNARADMKRLDEVVGPFNWKREHTRDNKNCIVSIYDENKKERVSKEDTGTESNQDAEKGLASDSFKRACFNRGIGRELYDYPFIWIPLKDGEHYEKGGKIKATNQFMRGWKREHTFENGVLQSLTATDKNGKVRYKFGQNNKTNNTIKKQKTNYKKKLRTLATSKIPSGLEKEQAIIEVNEYVKGQLDLDVFDITSVSEEKAKDYLFKLQTNDK